MLFFFFSVIFLYQTSVFAAACTLKYELFGIIKKPEIGDSQEVFFVKRLPENKLFIHTRNGYGALFDIANNNYTLIKIFHKQDIVFLMNVFTYKDSNGQDLFVACDSVHNVQVINLSKKNAQYEKLRVDNPCDLYQEVDGTLVLVNSPHAAAVKIEFTWQQIKKKIEGHNKILFQELPLLLPHSDIRIRDEGLIVSQCDLQKEIKPILSDDDFDLTSVPQTPENNLVCYRKNYKPYLSKIYSYHKTLDGLLYCGHGGTTISIWKVIDQERGHLGGA